MTVSSEFRDSRPKVTSTLSKAAIGITKNTNWASCRPAAGRLPSWLACPLKILSDRSRNVEMWRGRAGRRRTARRSSRDPADVAIEKARHRQADRRGSRMTSTGAAPRALSARPPAGRGDRSRGSRPAAAAPVCHGSARARWPRGPVERDRQAAVDEPCPPDERRHAEIPRRILGSPPGQIMCRCSYCPFVNDSDRNMTV